MRCVHTLTLLICLCIYYYSILPTHAHGQSESTFPIQQIPDNSRDWNSIKIMKPRTENTIEARGCIDRSPSHSIFTQNSSAECAAVQECIRSLPLGNKPNSTTTSLTTTLPDISGVSYSSDGKVLRGTIWLKNSFPDYLLNSQYYTNEIVNLSNLQLIKSFLRSHHDLADSENKDRLQEVLANVTGNNITTVVYNYTLKEENQTREAAIRFDRKSTTQWYTTSYDAPIGLRSAHKGFLRLYQPDIYQALFRESPSLSNDSTRQYPKSFWFDRGDVLNSSKNLWLFYDNTRKEHHPSTAFYPKPFWLKITYYVDIDIPSFYNSPVDYRLVIFWDGQAKKWTGELQEPPPIESSSTKSSSSKVLYSRPNILNFGVNRSYFDFSVNLSAIETPKTYDVLSGVESRFALDDKIQCSISDITNFVELPPPKISLSALPSSINMKPGDHKTLEIRANSSSHLPTQISLTPRPTPGMQLNLSSNIIDIPPLGTSSSTLHVKANDSILGNSKNPTYDTPIVVFGTATFPVIISESGSNKIYQNAQEKTGLVAIAHATIQNPTPINEQIYDIFHTSASTISDFQGVIAALAGIITPLGIFFGWLIRRKRSEGNIDSNQKYKRGSPIP